MSPRGFGTVVCREGDLGCRLLQHEGAFAFGRLVVAALFIREQRFFGDAPHESKKVNEHTSEGSARFQLRSCDPVHGWFVWIW